MSALTDEVDVQEGFRSTPYKDSRGLWTFGTGRCLETHPLTGSEWKYLLDANLISVTLSHAGADWLESEELDQVARYLARTFTWWPTLGEARQDALIDMGYQMGVDRLLSFQHMLEAVASGDWQQAYVEALNSDWAKQTPARARAVATQLRDDAYPPTV